MWVSLPPKPLSCSTENRAALRSGVGPGSDTTLVSSPWSPDAVSNGIRLAHQLCKMNHFISLSSCLPVFYFLALIWGKKKNLWKIFIKHFFIPLLIDPMQFSKAKASDCSHTSHVFASVTVPQSFLDFCALENCRPVVSEKSFHRYFCFLVLPPRFYIWGWSTIEMHLCSPQCPPAMVHNVGPGAGGVDFDHSIGMDLPVSYCIIISFPLWLILSGGIL